MLKTNRLGETSVTIKKKELAQTFYKCCKNQIKNKN